MMQLLKDLSQNKVFFTRTRKNRSYDCTILSVDKNLRKDFDDVNCEKYQIHNRSVKKIFIIAGEASGDYLGGKLIDDIRSLNSAIDFFGIGGEYMEAAGLRKLFSINELSIIGIVEIVGKIFHLKKLLKKTIDAISEYQPDVVVTIDSPGFTDRINKKIKQWKLNTKIVHYVAPSVWAWRKGRAKSMHKFIDKLLTLLPFEPELFQKHGLDSVFVGHPITTDKDFEKPDQSQINGFIESVFGNKKDKIITLLPGSRISELKKHLPILKKFLKLIAKKYDNVGFFIPTIKSLEQKINEIIKDWEQKPVIISDKQQKILAYYSSDLAVAASGTVTLELALTKVPSIIIYKTSAITAAIVKFLIKIKFVCLINILANKKIVPELLQNDCSAENIFAHAKKLLDKSNKETNFQKKSFAEIIKSLTPSDPKLAAKEVLKIN